MAEEDDTARGIAEWYASEARRKDRMARVARQTGAMAYVPSEDEGEFFQELQRSLRKPDPTANAFCATGEGGGIDNSCPPRPSGSFSSDQEFIGLAKLADIKSVKSPAAWLNDKNQILVSDLGLSSELGNPTGFGSAPPEAFTLMTLDPKIVKIKPSQAHVVRAAVEKKLTQGGFETPPGLIKHSDGSYTLVDGHHRAAAEILATGLIRGRVTEMVKGGLARNKPENAFRKPTTNAFCPTGPGGGIDNSCPPNQGGRQGWPGFPAEGHVTETPEFRQWFSGSKVIDSHGNPQQTAPIRGVRDNYGGEPVVVYHGTPRGEFHEFDPSMIANPEHLHYGPGFYFTEDVKAAEEFARGGQSSQATGSNPTVMSYYLKSLKPFDVDEGRINPSELPESERRAVRAAIVQKVFAEEGRSEAVDAGKAFDRGEYTMKYTELASDKGVGGYGVSKTAIREHLSSKGYDSITRLQNDVGAKGANRYWIVFQPTQVKGTRNKGQFSPQDANVLNELRREFGLDS